MFPRDGTPPRNWVGFFALNGAFCRWPGQGTGWAAGRAEFAWAAEPQLGLPPWLQTSPPWAPTVKDTNA